MGASVYAQQPVLDSLEQLIATGNDTLRIDALIQLARKMRGPDMEKAVQLQARARDEAAALGDPGRQAKALNDMGVSYGMQENYAEALSHFRQSLQLHQSQNNLPGVADGYNNLGIVYRYIGDYGRSHDAHLKALEIYDELNDLSGRAASLHNIGVVYDLAKDPQKALDFFEQALVLRKELKDEPGRALTLHNIALMHEMQGRYDTALEYMFEHLEILKTLEDRRALPNSLNSIGKVYLSLGDDKTAATYLNQSREKSAELDMKQPLAHALYNLAKIHIRQNEPGRAVPLLEEHIRIADDLGRFSLQLEGHDLMAEVRAQLDDYKGAFRHARLAAQYRDSLFNEDKTQAFQQWQARLDVYEKDRQLQQQDQELQWLESRARADRRLRWALLTAFALAVFSAVLFYQKYRLRQRNNQMLLLKNQLIETQKAKIEQVNRELEKRMLRAQINPHFIFNSLSSIQHFITADDRPSALRYLAKFSTLLRQVLEDSLHTNVILAEEVKLLKIYLDLESLRFEQGFTYEITIDPDLDPYTVEMPILLIQPFVENAVLHGLLPKKDERRLNISFCKTEGFTQCRITDNGIGRAAAAALNDQKTGKRPSRGIELTQKRLNTLYKPGDEQALIAIRDLFHPDGSTAGTEVVVNIPES